ncbi:MAG: PHP domain-containing protein [Elusimicrobia bacterium]|nr:PHP domain-containing protein [Elusimicrobiota bacterium]
MSYLLRVLLCTALLHGSLSVLAQSAVQVKQGKISVSSSIPIQTRVVYHAADLPFKLDLSGISVSQRREILSNAHRAMKNVGPIRIVVKPGRITFLPIKILQSAVDKIGTSNGDQKKSEKLGHLYDGKGRRVYESRLVTIADFHTHSLASDGTQMPTEVVAKAHQDSVGILSLSEHDNVYSYGEAAAEAEKLGVLQIPGAELSAEQDHIHVLGPFVDPNHPDVVANTERVRVAREVRVRKILEKLKQGNIHLDFEDVLAEYKYPNVLPILGRSHVADALVTNGYAQNKEKGFAILRKPEFAVPMEGIPTLEEVLKIIKSAGGLTFIAHPNYLEKAFGGRWTTELERYIQEFGPKGKALLDGLEGFRRNYKQGHRKHYQEMAKLYELLLSVGSDFHGDMMHPYIGGVAIPIRYLREIAERAPGPWREPMRDKLREALRGKPFYLLP